MRVHMGCGSVYLTGWLNVDVPQPGTHLAADRPDLVERWRTDDEDYYARHLDKTIETLRQGALEQEYVCDRYGSFAFIPTARPITEFLARHSFEHLSIEEARAALLLLRRHMAGCAVLRLDVPDHEATLKAYRDTGDVFYIRHLLGPRRNERGFHMMSYTPETLVELVFSCGFNNAEMEPNIHLYPAFCMRFTKAMYMS